MPTSIAGEAVLGFDFKLGDRRSNRQEIKAWLKSTPRDWIVVGFAAGTVGHETLKGHMEALGDAGHDAGTSTDGQLSLYAKGRVRGKWMLTLAYDSDKPTDRLRRQGLLSTIDPDQFYTLYGDGTRQAYDASSADKLYLKLERDQFYAMFGDFTTGLDDGELTRYHRTLNGLKVEYQGELFEANAFAAETQQSFARDEIQGDGTSGLYRLSRRGIAINGERVRIEVRNRYHSEQIVEISISVNHDGTRAAAEYIVLGTYLKTDEGLPPATGQRYTLPAGAFFEVADGLIRRVTVYYNLTDWTAQVAP